MNSLCAWRGRTRRGDNTRLRGALKNLGHELGRNTIKRLLAEHGIAPAPERGRSMSWSTFIKAHWGAIAATDDGSPSAGSTGVAWKQLQEHASIFALD